VNARDAASSAGEGGATGSTPGLAQHEPVAQGLQHLGAPRGRDTGVEGGREGVAQDELPALPGTSPGGPQGPSVAAAP
jgi:hypothetical protein